MMKVCMWKYSIHTTAHRPKLCHRRFFDADSTNNNLHNWKHSISVMQIHYKTNAAHADTICGPPSLQRCAIDDKWHMCTVTRRYVCAYSAFTSHHVTASNIVARLSQNVSIFAAALYQTTLQHIMGVKVLALCELMHFCEDMHQKWFSHFCPQWIWPLTQWPRSCSAIYSSHQ